MNRDLLLFLLLAFGLSWGWAAAFYFAGVPYLGPFGILIGAGFMLFPAVAAIIVDKRRGKKLRHSLWFSFQPNRFWLVAWLLPIILIMATLGASLLVPGVGFDPNFSHLLSHIEDQASEEDLQIMLDLIHGFPWPLLFLLQILMALGAGATINAAFALGEEIGWRAFMLRELAHKGFWTSALLIGIAWGLWHTPLILQGHNYPEHPLLGVFLMTLFCVLYSPLFSWVTLKSGSVLVAGIMHGVFNASAGIAIVYLDNFMELITGPMGLAGLSVLLAANILLYLLARPDIDELLTHLPPAPDEAPQATS